MATEIVSFPINNMVMFHSYVNAYQMVFEKCDRIATVGRASMGYLVGGLDHLFFNMLGLSSSQIYNGYFIQRGSNTNQL